MCAARDERPPDAHMANTAMYAPPNRFLPQSAIGAHLVKPLTPGHIPASFPSHWRARTPRTSGPVCHDGWRTRRAFFDVCEPRREPPERAAKPATPRRPGTHTWQTPPCMRHPNSLPSREERALLPAGVRWTAEVNAARLLSYPIVAGFVKDC